MPSVTYKKYIYVSMGTSDYIIHGNFKFRSRTFPGQIMVLLEYVSVVCLFGGIASRGRVTAVNAVTLPLISIMDWCSALWDSTSSSSQQQYMIIAGLMNPALYAAGMAAQARILHFLYN